MRRPPALWALSPGELGAAQAADFAARAAQACAGGLRGIVLREFALEDRDYLALARALAAALHALEPAGWLAVHDRAHLLAASGADALHLSFRSVPIGELRAWLGPQACLGLSVHRGDAPERWAAADYLQVGPVFPTPSKQGLVEPLGLDGLRDWLGSELARAPRPVWAVGGLRPEHAAALAELGLDGLAVRAGILGSADARAAAAAYAEAAVAFERGSRGGDAAAGAAGARPRS